MRWFLSLVVIAAVLIAQASNVSAQAVTLPTLYDNFNSLKINPDKWEVTLAPVNLPGQGPPGYAETAIGQAFGRMAVASRTYGSVGPAGGRIRVGNVNLRMKDLPEIVTGYQMTARILGSEVTGCNASPPSRVRIRMNLSGIFRAGPNPSGDPSDLTNVFDVLMVIQARRDLPANTFQVLAAAEKCGDAACNVTPLDEVRDFPNVGLNQDVILSVETDTVNKRFIFTVNNTVRTVDYGAHLGGFSENFADRGVNFHAIQLIHEIETCPTRATGWMAAAYDNIRIAP